MLNGRRQDGILDENIIDSRALVGNLPLINNQVDAFPCLEVQEMC